MMFKIDEKGGGGGYEFWQNLKILRFKAELKFYLKVISEWMDTKTDYKQLQRGGGGVGWPG